MLAAAVLAISALVVSVPVPGVAAAPRAVEGDARASVLAATLDVQPSFDPALADSRATSSSVGATSLNSVAWPGFLVDAFFFLYGFQSVERIGAGIAEARYPQGPTTSKATHSDLVFANGGDPDDVPSKGGKSESRAGNGTAAGSVAVGESTLPGDLVVGAASSASSVDTRNERVSARARQLVHSVRIGALRIAFIEGSAEATAGDAGAGARSHLLVSGATVNGTAVAIDGDGVRARSADAQEDVDAALRDTGVSVTLVPAARERSAGAASASSGGVLVVLDVEQTDPSGTPRNVRVGYLLGAASAGARSEALSVPTHVLGDGSEAPRFVYTDAPVIDTRPGGGDDDGADDRAFRRRVIVVGSIARGGVGARGAYAAVVLVALGLILMRPLMRAAARP